MSTGLLLTVLQLQQVWGFGGHLWVTVLHGVSEHPTLALEASPSLQGFFFPVLRVGTIIFTIQNSLV